jgi:hypothetical protein
MGLGEQTAKAKPPRPKAGGDSKTGKGSEGKNRNELN